MKQLFTLFIVFLTYNIGLAQETTVEQTIDTPKSIKNQFEFIYNKSNNYTQFKVVKRDWLNKLKAQTLDSLKNIESELKKAEAKINSQQQIISKSEKNLEQVKQDLTLVTNEKDEMPFLGINTSKKTYSTIVWSIVAILLLLLSFFIFKFNKSNAVTKNSKESLKELELEFEDYRRRALEREQKVMRKLQDELNKKK